MRIAAGICAVAAGLMFGAGGGAIAGADSDSNISSGANQGTDSASRVASAFSTGGATSVANRRSTLTTLTTLGDDSDPAETPRLGDAGDESTTLLSDDDEGAAGITGDDEITEPGPTTTVTEPTIAELDTTVTTPVPTAPAWSPTTSSGSSTSTTEPTASSAPQPADPKAPVVKALQPVSDAVNTWVGVLSSVPGTVAALPSSQTPITDAIASVQWMLTTVAGTVGPLTQVPGDLYTLFSAAAPTDPPPLIGHGLTAAGPVVGAPAADASLFGPPRSPAHSMTPPMGDASLFGTMAPRPALGTAAPNGVSAPLAVSGTVPLNVGTTTGARSLFEHVLEAVLVPASLTALAALALPGIGGLLIVAAAGVRLGYRQAKAALALRASGIARFAGTGPLGVVRTGSLVTLRQRARGPRTARAVCPEASRKARALEPVA